MGRKFRQISVLTVAMLVVAWTMTFAAGDTISGTIQNLDATKGMVTIKEPQQGRTVQLQAAPELLAGLQKGDAVQVRMSGKRATVIQKQESSTKPMKPMESPMHPPRSN